MKRICKFLEGPGYLFLFSTLMGLTLLGVKIGGLIGGILMPFIWLGTVFWCSQFIYHAFDLPRRAYAFQAMLSYLYNIKFAVLIVKGGKLPQPAKDKPMIKMGGPGIMKVAADTVVVTEKGGKPNVRGPGSHFLRPGEEIIEALDLRQQVRSGKVKAMTRDGIPVEVDCTVGFRLARSPWDMKDREKSKQRYSPPYKWAALQATYNKSVTNIGPSPWHERVIAAAQGAVRELIARYTLDELHDTRRRDAPPRPRLMEELKAEVQKIVRSLGVEVAFASFGTLEIPDAAVRRYLEAWAAHWRTKTWFTITRLLQAQEKAGAEAVDNIARTQALEILEAIARDPATKIYFPMESLRHIHIAPEEQGQQAA